MAKRYLVAGDQGYHGGLSETSKRTLKFQVCPLVLLCCVILMVIGRRIHI
jgi:hypothetical protein